MTNEIAREYGHPQLWPLPELHENKEILVLPPNFTLHRLHATIMRTATTSSALLRVSYSKLFRSNELQHIHICTTERGMCVCCQKWTDRANALRTVVFRVGPSGAKAIIELKVLRLLHDN